MNKLQCLLLEIIRDSCLLEYDIFTIKEKEICTSQMNYKSIYWLSVLFLYRLIGRESCTLNASPCILVLEQNMT